MDEILGSVNCASDRWQILIRKNWLIEIRSLYGGNAVNTNVVLNYVHVKDLRKLSELFAKAADFFEKEEENQTYEQIKTINFQNIDEKIKYLEDRWDKFKSAAEQLAFDKIKNTPLSEILKNVSKTR